jgi:hypothetical protein
VFVAVRMPQVIPGVATIEIRTRADVDAIDVVPMRLTGPGSEHPATPDRATRAADDPRFFTAELWLMEHGAMQVRVAITGAGGRGELSVPIPAVAQRTETMDRTLGAFLFAAMLVLALALVSIATAAARESGLAPGDVAAPSALRRSRIATVIASALVIAVLAAGYAWCNKEATVYERVVARPWKLAPTVDGCQLALPAIETALLPDHGHDIHLFVIRTPSFDRLAHLHPERQPDGRYAQRLPSLPAGHYAIFADVVLPSGFPVTGTGRFDLAADLACDAPSGDDSTWSADAPSTSIVFDAPPRLRAGEATALRFRVVDRDGSPARDVEPYMAMAGHAAVVRRDLGVFAHLHPSGTIAMPSMMLARTPHEMYGDGRTLPPEVSFPYGFPSAGEYRVFVQIKRAGRVETGSFDLAVSP